MPKNIPDSPLALLILQVAKKEKQKKKRTDVEKGSTRLGDLKLLGRCASDDPAFFFCGGMNKQQWPRWM